MYRSVHCTCTVCKCTVCTFNKHYKLCYVHVHNLKDHSYQTGKVPAHPRESTCSSQGKYLLIPEKVSPERNLATTCGNFLLKNSVLFFSKSRKNIFNLRHQCFFFVVFFIHRMFPVLHQQEPYLQHHHNLIGSRLSWFHSMRKTKISSNLYY